MPDFHERYICTVGLFFHAYYILHEVVPKSLQENLRELEWNDVFDNQPAASKCSTALVYAQLKKKYFK